MTAFGVFYVFVLIGLGAIIVDHYSRLTKMGWMPESPEGLRGRSALDPVGGALGELGRADGLHKVIAAGLGPIAKATEMAFAPIGAGLGMVAKGTELVFNGIGAALGAMTGFGLKGR